MSKLLHFPPEKAMRHLYFITRLIPIFIKEERKKKKEKRRKKKEERRKKKEEKRKKKEERMVLKYG